MHSLRSAAALLEASTTAAATAGLLAELGFDPELVPLDTETRQTLDLPSSVRDPRIARGSGELRALAFDFDDAGDLRATVSRVASRLSSRAPHLLWLLAAVDRQHNRVAIATWDPGRTPPRIAALLCDRSRIVDSDSETICALAAARTPSPLLTHSRWNATLGKESITRSFFRALRQSVENMARHLEPAAPSQDSSELALLYVSRLLFLSFLQTKGWLDRDHAFLGNQYADCMLHGGGYHRRILAPLFFGTLNTHPRNRAPRAQGFGRVPFLNGGLFSRSPLEKRNSLSFFDDESLGDLFGNVLDRYRFTAREDGSAWSEAAIDPEMLGKAFESLMSAPERKTSGAFYTPQPLVEQLMSSTLAHALSSRNVTREQVSRALTGEIPRPALCETLLATIDAIRVLDPACGSGAFLVYALEQLSALRVRLGDPRPTHHIRRGVLIRSIFGVDINPTAVWLCELRLWLSMAIEDPETEPSRVLPLPNLDRQIRVGDSLLGGSFGEIGPTGSRMKFASVRGRYARAVGPRKRTLSKILDRAERECALELLGIRIERLACSRRDLLAAVRSRDLFGERPVPSTATTARLAELRAAIRLTRRELRTLAGGGALPFSFPTHFADVGSGGGFDIVIGNPPWVRTHNLSRSAKSALVRGYDVARDSGWRAGAHAAGAAPGFAGQVDVAALFVERGVRLARDTGVVGLIIPAKLWRSLAGGGLRAFLLRTTDPLEVHDLTGSRQPFDAAVYPSLLIARRRIEDGDQADSPPVERQREDLLAVVQDGDRVSRWRIANHRLPLDDSHGSPWILAPPEVRAAFEKLAEAGVGMSRTVIGRPLLGVKTGCNEVFIVSDACRIEREVLRPLLRGESVKPWRIDAPRECIIWTHGGDGRPLRTLPEAARAHLIQWRRVLEQRSDARRGTRWWALFRTESADAVMPRVVWADIGKCPRAAVLPAGDSTVPLNSCYVARCPTLEDARALATLLNSELIAAWANLLAEPARGRYHRYLGWTMAILPLPSDWPRAREILAPFGERAIGGDVAPQSVMMAAVLEAFRLSEADVAPLLAWNRR